MNSYDSNNTNYKALIKAACRSTRELFSLINKNKIQINESVSSSKDDRLPLVIAIEEDSLPLVSLLLEKGADPNALDGLPLGKAIQNDNIEIAKILLAKGANPNGITRSYDGEVVKILSQAITGFNLKKLEKVRLLLDHGAEITIAQLRQAVQMTDIDDHKSDVLKLIVDRTWQLFDDPEADNTTKLLGKFSQLCKSILDDDESRLTELLGTKDYGELTDGEDHRQCPGSLAVRLDRLNLVGIFLRMGYGLNKIYLEAAVTWNLELIELCAKCSGFDPQVCDVGGNSALHLAIQEDLSSEPLGLIEILVRKYGLSFDAQNKSGRTPLANVVSGNDFMTLFAAFPEINANQMCCKENSLLGENDAYCFMYTVLLEYGADPSLYGSELHKCEAEDEDKCAVIDYFQKLLVIDPVYAQRLARFVLPESIQMYSSLSNFDKEEYEVEIAKMKSLQISRSTSSAPARSLLDVIFFGANEAARFSRNVIILALYEEYKQDFEKFLPNFGFILNYKLRKGAIRHQRLEAAMNLLCSALGTGLPQDFAELIFGSFSNKTLERFSLDMILK